MARTSTSRTIASSDSHGISSGQSSSSSSTSRSNTSGSGVSESSPSTCRSSSRQAEYGVSRVYTSQLACSSAHPLRRVPASSASSRDLPMPISPVSSMSVPEPPRARATENRRWSSSESRPTSGSSSRIAPSDAPRSVRPISHACTECDLPLTVNGSSQRLLEARLRTAQHLASRVDVAGRGLGHQARRQIHDVAHDRVRPSVVRPDLAVNTGPRLTPTRTGSGVSASTMWRSVSSIRSSSSPIDPRRAGAQ